MFPTVPLPPECHIRRVSTWFGGIPRLKFKKFIGPGVSPCSVPPSPCSVPPSHCFVDGSYGSYPAGISYMKRFHMIWRDSTTNSIKVYLTMTKSLLRSTKSCSVPPSHCFVDGSNGSYPAGISYTKRFHMVWRDSTTKSLKIHLTMTKSLLRSTKSLLRSSFPPLH